MTRIWTKAILEQKREAMGFKSGTRVAEQFRPGYLVGGKFVREFVAPEDFGAAWQTRQRYELDAGAAAEPLLYTPLFSEMADENFPSSVTINTIGPGGVVLSELKPGGETKFASIGEGSKTIPMKDYTVGIEYSERMFVYNEFFGVELFERAAGVANNALLNHVHLSPFLTATYGAANQTAASAVGSTLAEKTLRTLEDAVKNASTDNTTTVLGNGQMNRRRGPYALLCSMANFFTIERALSGAQVVGVDMNSSVRAKITDIIAYDGWSGEMQGEATDYAGVTANKAYLIDISTMRKSMYAISLIKFLLRQLNGNEDVSRLVRQQEVLWSSVGVYVNALAMAEEVTLPTS